MERQPLIEWKRYNIVFKMKYKSGQVFKIDNVKEKGFYRPFKEKELPYGFCKRKEDKRDERGRYK